MKPDAVIPVTISDSPASDAELSALASLMVAHYVRTHIDEDWLRGFAPSCRPQSPISPRTGDGSPRPWANANPSC
jgi:hypothetical protein